MRKILTAVLCVVIHYKPCDVSCIVKIVGTMVSKTIIVINNNIFSNYFCSSNVRGRCFLY